MNTVLLRQGLSPRQALATQGVQPLPGSRCGARVFFCFSAVTALFAAGCTTVAQTSTSADANAATHVMHAATHAGTSLEPFPPAAPGHIRWVIVLPAQAHEDQFRVELLPSIRMRTDCNHHAASAKVERHDVQGWGYGYQVMGDVGPVVSTLMGCPEGQAQERGVLVHADLALQRYNSRVPIVFYTPAQVTLRYRLWRVEGEVQAAVPS